MKSVDFQIMGHDYRVNCPNDGEASLKAAAQVVDHAMTTIRNAGMVRSHERIAVLACLNLAAELSRLRTEVDSLRGQIKQQTHEVQVDHARQQLYQDLIHRLDQALANDDHLL